MKRAIYSQSHLNIVHYTEAPLTLYRTTEACECVETHLFLQVLLYDRGERANWLFDDFWVHGFPEIKTTREHQRCITQMITSCFIQTSSGDTTTAKLYWLNGHWKGQGPESGENFHTCICHKQQVLLCPDCVPQTLMALCSIVLFGSYWCTCNGQCI